MDIITATQLMPVLTRLMDGVLEGIGSQAWESLVRLVKHHDRRAPELDTAIQAVADKPGDTKLLSTLAAALDSESRTDAEFAQQLQEWYTATEVTGQTTNIISGTVDGPVVQARDVHGGIAFGKN